MRCVIIYCRSVERSKIQEDTDDKDEDNNNLTTKSLLELHKFSLHCKQVDSVRSIKQALECIVNKVCTDIDRLTAGPLPPVRPHFQKSLPNKQFTHCNSMLTDLLEVRHFRTIYNIFVVILMMMLLNTFVNDYLADGSVNIGLEPIRLGLGKFHLALLWWTQMLALSMMMYVMLFVWAKIRSTIIEKSTVCILCWFPKNIVLKSKLLELDPRMWSVFCMVVYVSYQLTMIALTVRWVFYYDLPIATSIATLMELVRLRLKR